MCQTRHPERASIRDTQDVVNAILPVIVVVLITTLIIAVCSTPVFGGTKRSACKAACASVLSACGAEAKPRKCRRVTFALCRKRGVNACAVETTTTTTTSTTPETWVTTTSLAPGQTTTTTLYTKAMCNADCDGDYALCQEDMAECYAECEASPYAGCREECADFETLLGRSCEHDLRVCREDCAGQPD